MRNYYRFSAIIGGCLIVLMLIASMSQAAQQTISTISAATVSREDLRTKINTELGKANSNDVDLDGRVTANKAAALVGDCTVGPCLDGTSDGGNIIKLWDGTGSYWTALQGGAPAANRSWRLPIASPPVTGATQVMTMDQYGQMAFMALPASSGLVLSSTDAGVLSWEAGGSGGAVSDVAYDATSWDGVTTTAPSKNAVRDAVEALPTLTFSTGLTNTSGTITVTNPTVVAGTSALGTSAIGSGACASTVTTPATGTLTTDIIDWGFNADPTSTTGYSASANGMLTIISFPSAGNVNFRVCNNTAASITPGAATLNWKVGR